MSFKPYPSYSGFIFLSITAVFGVAIIFFIDRLLVQVEPARAFLYLVGLLIALALAGLGAYWTVVAFRLNYHINRNGLAIQWGLSQQRIPIDKINNIMWGRDVAAPLEFKGFVMDGLHLGWGKLAEYNLLKFRTTAPIYQSLLIVTPRQTYLISPRHPQKFIDAWQARQHLGPTQQWTTSARQQWPLNIPVLLDPLTWWLLGAAALLTITLLGYISLRYAELPPSLPIHFNNLGRADRIADKITLFIFPAAGATFWAINALLGGLIYKAEKLGAYLLWGSSIAIELCLWVAVFTITA